MPISCCGLTQQIIHEFFRRLLPPALWLWTLQVHGAHLQIQWYVAYPPASTIAMPLQLPCVAVLHCFNAHFTLQCLYVQDRIVYDIVNRKQRHVCSPKCLTNGLCERGFPMPLHTCATPRQDPESGIWRYPRYHASDRDIVPYHRPTLLLWQAHHNVQIVSTSIFCGYLLKYEMKADCAGELDLTPQPCIQTCFPHLDPDEQSTVAAYSASRIVSPCEVGLQNASISMVEAPSVRYIDTSLPGTCAGSKFTAHVSHMDIYLARPTCLADTTFTDFHRHFTTQSQHYYANDIAIGFAAGEVCFVAGFLILSPMCLSWSSCCCLPCRKTGIPSKTALHPPHSLPPC